MKKRNFDNGDIDINEGVSPYGNHSSINDYTKTLTDQFAKTTSNAVKKQIEEIFKNYEKCFGDN